MVAYKRLRTQHSAQLAALPVQSPADLDAHQELGSDAFLRMRGGALFMANMEAPSATGPLQPCWRSISLSPYQNPFHAQLVPINFVLGVCTPAA